MTDRSDAGNYGMTGASGEELQLEELRRLLGVADVDGVSQILRRLDDPDIGARDLSGVLADAVMLSSRADNRLGDALEPSVQRALHNAIHNDPAPVADALYPALAPTIRRAIAETLRGMVQSLNELLEHSLSIQGLRWRLQALRTRRPFAEVILSNSLVYRVEQAFLIHRETGLLLQHVVDPAAEAQDPDLVSSMVTAIQDFVHDSSVVGDDACLQDFRVGDLTVWIERGRDAVLAVAIRGNAPETLREDLRALLRAIHLSHFEELENFEGDAASFDSARDDLRGCLVSNYRKPTTRPSPMLWLILLVILAALGFWLVSSFRDHRRCVEDQRYLDRLLTYIHLNPVSAGIVDDPAVYGWSGHREILGRTRQPITDVDEVLMLFGKTRRSARQAYVRAIKGTVAEPWVGEGPGRLPWWKLGRPKGEEDEVPDPDSRVAFIDELGRSTGLERPKLDTVRFIKEGAAFLGVQVEDLAGRGRASDVVRAREMLATLAVERYRIRVMDIASEFNKSAEAASRMVSRGTGQRLMNSGFRDEFEELDRHLARAAR